MIRQAPMIAQPLFASETRTTAALFLPEKMTAGIWPTGVDGEQSQWQSPGIAGREQPCNGCSSAATLCRLVLTRLSPYEHTLGMAMLNHSPFLQGGGWQLFPKASRAVNAGLR